MVLSMYYKLQNFTGEIITSHDFFLQKVSTARLPVPGHFYSCVVSKYLLRENEISFLLL